MIAPLAGESDADHLFLFLAAMFSLTTICRSFHHISRRSSSLSGLLPHG